MYFQDNRVVRTACIFFIIALSILECLVSIWRHGKVETTRAITENQDYRWWLLITVILSSPAIIERFLDSLKSMQTKKDVVETLMRSCKVLSLAVPNIGLLIALVTNIFGFKNYDAVFGPQEIVVITTILSSTFGNSIFYGLEGLEPLMMSVEHSTLALLIAYMFQRSITLVLMASDSNKFCGYSSLIMGSTCITCLSLAWVVYVTIIVSLELGRHMVNYKFSNYYQMHDFFRMISVVVYIIYNAAICFCYSGELSGFSYYTLESIIAIAILIGQVGLLIVLILVDSRSLLHRAELTEDKLQVRLDLVRYLSHEMRSPLNTAFMGLQLMYYDEVNVLAYLKTLVPTSPDVVDSFRAGPSQALLDSLSKMKTIIETNVLVQESSNLVLETLNDMLTFDKLEERKLVLELKDVDVWSFIQETVRPFTINAAKSAINLSMRCVDEASLWTDKNRIKVDKFKLGQVVRNFMSNALKFARSDGGAVEVTVEKIVCPQSKVIHTPNAVPMVRVCVQEFVRVSVVDNGCGISLHHLHKLFGQYVQFNAGELQKGGGSGLGLWIAKSLVELHGGIIGAVSDGANTGSTFFFELPLYDDRSLEFDVLQAPAISPDLTEEHSNANALLRPAIWWRQITSVVRSVFEWHEQRQQRLNLAILAAAAVVARDKEDAHRAKDAAVAMDSESYSTNLSLPKKLASLLPPLSPVASYFDNMLKQQACDAPLSSNLGTSSCGCLSFLLVDDSAISRKVTNRLLSLHGHMVEEATDGLDFLRKMGFHSNPEGGSEGTTLRKSVDVILMDDNMPCLSGPDATAAIRSYGYTGLIIGVTGNLYENQVAYFLSKGADRVVAKPLDLQDLEGIIREKMPHATLIANTAAMAKGH